MGIDGVISQSWWQLASYVLLAASGCGGVLLLFCCAVGCCVPWPLARRFAFCRFHRIVIVYRFIVIAIEFA